MEYKVGMSVVVNFLGTKYPAKITGIVDSKTGDDKKYYTATGIDGIKYVYISTNNSGKFTNINDSEQSMLTNLIKKYEISNTRKSKKNN